jgi:hypothetical protein
MKPIKQRNYNFKLYEDDGTNYSEVIKEPIYGCSACEELARAMSNPCQCLSCDPDGTRYICTCDEDKSLDDE